MAEEEPRGVRIIEAHQELVRHVEESSARIRTLAIVTVVVAALLAGLYAYQLAVPLAYGQTIVTVDLTSPANVATELVVLGLALVWLYVGAKDYVFATKLAGEIRRAREDEKTILADLSG
ncbi:MAG: hypothetical protein LYZ70_01015 [Nitrososphaerales archaeon]|nr:hypothetical protein [Nitrososphaerales archaeon]